jgi:hypothetical protein
MDWPKSYYLRFNLVVIGVEFSREDHGSILAIVIEMLLKQLDVRTDLQTN